MVDAIVLEAVEPIGSLAVAPSRPFNKVIRKPIQKSFRPWLPQKFTSLTQVEVSAARGNFSHYKRGDALYVVVDNEWFIYIGMYGGIWRRPAVRVQTPSLDVQLFAPIGHCMCEHCGKTDVASNYVTLLCLGMSYRICKKHLKSGELNYIRDKYKVEVVHDKVAR